MILRTLKQKQATKTLGQILPNRWNQISLKQASQVLFMEPLIFSYKHLGVSSWGCLVLTKNPSSHLNNHQNSPDRQLVKTHCFHGSSSANFRIFHQTGGLCFPWYVNELNELTARTSKPKLFSETSSNLTRVGGSVFNLSIFIWWLCFSKFRYYRQYFQGE